MMKIALLTSATLIANSTFVAQSAKAAQWCAVMNLGDLAENCHFVSRKQCQASLTGNSDFCRPYYGQDRRPDAHGGRSRR